MYSYIPLSSDARPLNPLLQGTNLVADDLYLIAHHELTGRPRLAARALGIGLAGGLIAELMGLWGAVTIERGHLALAPALTPPAMTPGYLLPPEPVARWALQMMLGESRRWLVRDWLQVLGESAAKQVAYRLMQAGYLRVHEPRFLGRSRLVPADPDAAHCALTRARHPGSPSAARELYPDLLAGLALACGLRFRLAQVDEPPALHEVTGNLPGALAALIAEVKALADALSLSAAKLLPYWFLSDLEVLLMQSSVPAAGAPLSPVSRMLASNRLGTFAVMTFIVCGVAPLTVSAGVIPTAFGVTGLTGIPVAFIAVGVVLVIFTSGYVAMSRHIVHAGALYAYITRGLGRPLGVAAALIALGAYICLQVGLYGAFGPQAQTLAAGHLNLHASWWVWAVAGWAAVTVLGLLKVNVTGRVLGVLLMAELVVILALSVSGLAHPAGGHLSFTTLSPAALVKGGWGLAGVPAAVAVLGYSGFEAGPILAEEARNARRVIPRATMGAVAGIGGVYVLVSWVMTVNAGPQHVVAAAAAQGPGLLFGMGSPALATTGNVLYLTSLLAALLAFHTAVLRYAFSLSREGVLPELLSRTGTNNIPWVASLAQSGAGLGVIVSYAIGRWQPMSSLFFGFGTTGGVAILLLLALTSIAVIGFFRRDHRGESLWCRLIAPAIAAVALSVFVALTVWHYSVLLGIPPGALASWLLPALIGAVGLTGLGWGLYLRRNRRQVYATLGLGAQAIMGQTFYARQGAR